MEPAKEEKIRVAIRVRPCATASHDAITCSSDGQSVLVYADASRASAASFRCGMFLGPTISQDAVFRDLGTSELIEAALDGFPVTIFAYGQTGAGKSFTIFGKEDAPSSSRSHGISGSVSASDGILPRAAQQLMEIVAQRRDAIDYTLRVTCVEIYNEQVRDLFDPKKEPLAIRHSKEHAFFLENATVVQCKTAIEMVRVVKLAAANRTKSAHLLNERSNRSHCLVTIYIDSAPRDGSHGGIKKYGKLTIVDLAGSERANDTGAVGQQLKETGHINKSLYCLSNVIQALTANSSASGKLAKLKFVPYRDSKLTMLLIDSLGGNSKTLMLACVNAAPQFATESTRTLEFAMGVARIKNRPTAMLNPHEKLISDLKEEIRLLKLENMMLRARTPGDFAEFPENEERDDEQVTSPLHRVLVTGRDHPDDPTTTETDRYQLAHRGGNNHYDAQETAQYMHSAGSAVATGLGGIKKLAMMRRGSTSPKKKQKPLPHKLKKKKKKAPTTKSRANAPSQFALPPVKQPMALFHKRELERTPPLARDQALSQPWAPSKQRPSTPPPEYDDLFGIETVSLSKSTNQEPLHRLESLAVSAKRSFSSLPNVQQSENRSIASPSEQIQRLLRDMMTSTSSSPSLVRPHGMSVPTIL